MEIKRKTAAWGGCSCNILGSAAYADKTTAEVLVLLLRSKIYVFIT
jgi:hypothetical protein